MSYESLKNLRVLPEFAPGVTAYLNTVATKALRHFPLAAKLDPQALVERVYHVNGYQHGGFEGVTCVRAALPGAGMDALDWHGPHGDIETAIKNNRILESWTVDGNLSRIDGPAHTKHSLEGNLLDKSWYRNGALHREDGPAHLTYNSGNGKVLLERWFLNGVKHRSDGPAYTYHYPNGRIETNWWLNGVLGRMEIRRTNIT